MAFLPASAPAQVRATCAAACVIAILASLWWLSGGPQGPGGRILEGMANTPSYQRELEQARADALQSTRVFEAAQSKAAALATTAATGLPTQAKVDAAKQAKDVEAQAILAQDDKYTRLVRATELAEYAAQGKTGDRVPSTPTVSNSASVAGAKQGAGADHVKAPEAAGTASTLRTSLFPFATSSTVSALVAFTVVLVVLAVAYRVVRARSNSQVAYAPSYTPSYAPSYAPGMPLRG